MVFLGLVRLHLSCFSASLTVMVDLTVQNMWHGTYGLRSPQSVGTEFLFLLSPLTWARTSLPGSETEPEMSAMRLVLCKSHANCKHQTANWSSPIWRGSMLRTHACFDVRLRSTAERTAIVMNCQTTFNSIRSFCPPSTSKHSFWV